MKKEKKYIGMILYIIPMISISAGVLINYLSVFAGGLFLKENGQKIEYKKEKKNIYMAIYLVAICFLLRYMYHIGAVDDGVTIYGYKVLPTYTILIYLIIAFFFRKKYAYSSKRFDFKRVKKGIIMCGPIMITYIYKFLLYSQKTSSVGDNIYEIWSCIFIAAIVEEFYFRGLLYEILKRSMSVIGAQLITSFIFLVWHFNVITLFIHNPNTFIIYNMICIFCLGMITCYIYDKTKTIISPIILHAINNGLIIYTLRIVFRS